ncbi:hypothetical protein [Paenibacillus sp. SYP-B3998]|uniref:hypothetical protein n=1 Tax=Paenibacillus sp. SYP-B3998 TaxID=2678564 RepID=UPI001F08082D|nr:hypothetical protein [Paenibacillus sp. SYP-B3998]
MPSPPARAHGRRRRSSEGLAPAGGAPPQAYSHIPAARSLPGRSRSAAGTRLRRLQAGRAARYRS